jgi:hypothetical protein
MAGRGSRPCPLNRGHRRPTLPCTPRSDMKNPTLRPYRVLLHIPGSAGPAWVVVHAFTELGARTTAENSFDGAKALHIVRLDLDCQGVAQGGAS